MMKIYLTTILILSAFVSQAQLSKGKILLGGSVNAGSSKITNGSSSDKINGFNISPSIGLFYKENRAAGVIMSYGHQKNTSGFAKENSYGGGFFLRQYKPLKSGFYLFMEELLSGSYSKREAGNNLNGSMIRYTSFGGGLRPGISYTVKSNLQLELVLNNLVYISYYSEKGTSYPSNTTTENKGLNVGSNLTLNPLQNIGIGVKFLLGK